jgi:hypothetical protein
MNVVCDPRTVNMQYPPRTTTTMATVTAKTDE